MNILILGDVMGNSGCKVLKENIKDIIEEKKIDFTVVNGENAAEDGKGITKEIADEFFNSGVNVITSGNHIWDKKETAEYVYLKIDLDLEIIRRFAWQWLRYLYSS